MKKAVNILMIALLVTGMSILLAGCKKKSDTPVMPESHDMDKMMDEAKDTADTMSEEAMKTAGAAIEEAKTIAAEQTVCPVMKGPIDKSVFVEYEGKKVYFCCPSCKAEFEKDPAKYIKDLPQFKQ